MSAQLKQALLISPRFFEYENDIVAALEQSGYSVHFIDERPYNSSVAKAAFRLSRRLLKRLTHGYFRKRLAEIAERKFDVVLVIKGEVTPPWFIRQLRDLSPKAIFSFYTFDSLRNSPQCLDIVDYFDQRFSFDPDDVKRRPDFIYKPLFFTDAFTNDEPYQDRDYDVAFIGTLHSGRYAIVKRLTQDRKNSLVYFYVPARWYFGWAKYITREFASIPWSSVKFRKISRAEVAAVFGQSRVVLDVQRTGQSGLTMRTFEVLASGASLATANAAIADTDVFTPSALAILEGSADDRFKIDLLLQADGHVAGSEAGVSQYSLDTWVADFLPHETC